MIKIKPDINCKACHGTGEVADSVDWWGASTLMWSFCSCVEEQIPEEAADEIVELDLSEYHAAIGEDCNG